MLHTVVSTSIMKARSLYCLFGFCAALSFTGSAFSSSSKECFRTLHGSDYRGSLDTTVSGRSCQMWGEQTPHPHQFGWMYTEKNYCRNPDGRSSGPWCYTTDLGKEWEECNVTKCDDPFDPCSSSPCLNGGICNTTTTPNGHLDYNCSCPEGWSDRQCQRQEPFRSCDSQPCENNGTCQADEYSYTCQCPEGYIGPTCAELVSPIYCGNGWDLRGEGCYKLHRSKLSRDDAQNLCNFYDGELTDWRPGDTDEKFLQLYNMSSTASNNVDLWTRLIYKRGKILSSQGKVVTVAGGNLSSVWEINGTCIAVNRFGKRGNYLYAANCNDQKSFACYKPKGRCPTGYYHHGEKCYLYRPYLLASFHDASQYCEGQGSILVEPKRLSEQTFLADIVMRMNSLQESRIWLGLKKDLLGNWMWASDETEVLYGNWYNVTDTKEYGCAYFDAGNDGKWSSDLSCTTPLGVLCVTDTISTVANDTNNTEKTPIDTPRKPLMISQICSLILTMGLCYMYCLHRSYTTEPVVSQWVSYIRNFSSQYNTDSWSADQVIGPSNVYPGYGDIVGTWAQARKSFTANEFIEVGFQEKLYIEKINIFETYNAGGVREIKARNPRGEWHTLWRTDAVQNIQRSRIFSPQLPQSTFPTDALRIMVNCTLANSYVEIDAIQMKGTRHRPGLAISSTKSKCGDGWVENPTDVFCYKILQDFYTWTEAQQACQREEAELISIGSPKEQAFLTGWLGSMKSLSQSVWTGGNCRDGIRGWRWSDGQPFKYINWRQGRPYNPPMSRECLTYSLGFYQWEDNSCSQVHPAICKKTYFNSATASTIIPSSATNASIGCPKDWQEYGQYCYLKQILQVTQPEAKTMCRKEEGYLVSLLSVAERNFVYGYLFENIPRSLNASVNVWIGLEYDVTNRVFGWLDDSEVLITDWGRGEPGYSDGNYPKCGMLAMENPMLYRLFQKTGMWYSANCDNSLTGFICKKKKGYLAVPTVPSSNIGCTQGSIGYRSYCYLFSNKSSSWSNSQTECENLGGNLATVSNRFVQAFMSSEIPIATEEYWIGYSHIESQSATWSSGAPVTFTYIEARESATQRTKGQSVGCFYDNRTRIMEAKMYGINSKTQCLNLCETQMKIYAGVQYQSECFCGNKIKNYPRRDESDCQEFRCSRNYNEFCGGTWAIGIFYTGVKLNDSCVVMSAKPPPGLWHYRLCSDLKRFVCELPREGFTTSTFPPSTTPPPRCNDTWSTYSQYCYKGFDDKLTWTEARSACRELGADLVSIHSIDESNFIRNTFRGIIGREIWIGLSDRETEGMYKWSDGTPLDYNAINADNWYNNEDCLTMKNANHRWNDIPCSLLRSFICKVQKGIPVKDKFTPLKLEKCTGTEFYSYNGYCYLINDSPAVVNYYEARRSCNAKGAELTSIHSMDETNMLLTLLYRFGSTDKIWIGLTELNDEFTYRWDDGSPLNFQNWHNSEPNDYGGEERCVMMKNGPGTWADYPCGFKHKTFICKKRNVTVIPLPTTTPPPLIHGGCPTGFTPSLIGNKCYFVSNYSNTETCTWEEALAKCKAYGRGAGLVSIKDTYEMAFVTSLLKDSYYGRWIGMSTKAAHSFLWLDNTEVTYTNWQPGQPRGGNSKCVRLWTVRRSGQWESSPCSGVNGYICQVPKDPSLPITMSSGCPVGYTHYMNRCFKLSRFPLTRDSAGIQCRSEGGGLASVTSYFEHEFIKVLAKSKDVDSFWIGLRFVNDSRLYVWEDGSPYVYSSWASETNKPLRKHCVLISNGTWHRISCDVTLPSMCEINLDPLVINEKQVDCKETQLGFSSSMVVGNNCFYGVTDHPLSWENANDACKLRGAHLASMTSSIETEHVHEYLRRTDSLNGPYWIGLSRQRNSGQTSGFGWYWTDGSALLYKHWAYGEPSGSLFDRNTECGEMMFSGYWNDVNCNTKQKFICKRKVVEENPASTVKTSVPIATTEDKDLGVTTTNVYTTTGRPKVIAEKLIKKSRPGSSLSLAAIVGIIAAIILIAATVVVLIILMARRLRKKPMRLSGFGNILYRTDSEQIGGREYS